MSKQLAYSITFSVLASLCLALFGVDPVNGLGGPGGGTSVIQVQASPLPGLTQLLPSLQ